VAAGSVTFRSPRPSSQGADEERAHRVAYNAVKHEFQKVGDRWEFKFHFALTW